MILYCTNCKPYKQNGINNQFQELPATISSGPEREVLALVCRVHELEADKLALQGERAARAHELRRRDLALQRRDAQRRLSDEIITRQRRALQGIVKLEVLSVIRTLTFILVFT